MILTDDQLIEALTEAGHDDIAEALTAKIGADGQTPRQSEPQAPDSIGDRLKRSVSR